jgi:DNA-binding CsgD family transcriptional regulator
MLKTVNCDGREIRRNNQDAAGVTGNKTRIEQAEARTEQAETRTEQAKTRAESAEMRTEQAETRTELAKTRTEQAEIRTEQAETRTEQAETALQRVVNKEIQLSPEISTRFLKKFPLQAIADRKSPLEELTERQREILQLIAEGQNTKQIAEILKVSPKTVEYHRMKLMDCLNIHDIPGLVRFAMQAGLLPQGKLATDWNLPEKFHRPIRA